MVHGIDALVAAKKPPFEAIDALVAAKTPPFRSYRRAGGCENAPPSTSCEASGMPNARPIIGISARLRPRLLSSSCVLGFVGLLSDLKGKAFLKGYCSRMVQYCGFRRIGGGHAVGDCILRSAVGPTALAVVYGRLPCNLWASSSVGRSFSLAISRSISACVRHPFAGWTSAAMYVCM